ncbi:hypothetical protein M3201_21490 [Paenibacillus motobuensis]|uniref:hypothetical protein n=1 Tax=Paenibacillus TaxID=44249 RepID=UPI00203D2B0D|nr:MULTISPECIES: hypothetical protein [Paenibacillus]MCM3042235.1 hypothetical protein [Paenibacillus lutimineralis]MCM3649339.1 hypothetical protein [Paenibacillus motobuensis]
MSYAHLQSWFESPRELTDTEKEWLNRLLISELVDRMILQKQVAKSKVIGECLCGCKSVNMQVDSTAPRYPHTERIPVEMTAFESGKAPVMFLLHVVNGYINELEVLRADSSPIDDAIDLSNIELSINIK